MKAESMHVLWGIAASTPIRIGGGEARNIVLDRKTVVALLAINVRNRKSNKYRIDVYADAMASGKWRWNTSFINWQFRSLPQPVP